MMRYTLVDTSTGAPVSQQPPPLGMSVKYQFFPRIKCLDCPGKLYTPGPGMGVENFEVHLKNRLHREKVEKRTGG